MKKPKHPQGICPACGKMITIREADGKLRKHKEHFNAIYEGPCKGTGKAPIKQPTLPNDDGWRPDRRSE
jgi:hypothetical protein